MINLLGGVMGIYFALGDPVSAGYAISRVLFRRRAGRRGGARHQHRQSVWRRVRFSRRPHRARHRAGGGGRRPIDWTAWPPELLLMAALITTASIARRASTSPNLAPLTYPCLPPSAASSPWPINSVSSHHPVRLQAGIVVIGLIAALNLVPIRT
jgi:hypothetical protein